MSALEESIVESKSNSLGHRIAATGALTSILGVFPAFNRIQELPPLPAPEAVGLGIALGGWTCIALKLGMAFSDAAYSSEKEKANVIKNFVKFRPVETFMMAAMIGTCGWGINKLNEHHKQLSISPFLDPQTVITSEPKSAKELYCGDGKKGKIIVQYKNEKRSLDCGN